MMKKYLGTFKRIKHPTKWDRKDDHIYRLFYHKGYWGVKGQKQYVFIGNSTFGYFFKFRFGTDYVFISNQGAKIFVDRSEEDVKKILEPILFSWGLELVELAHKSRREIEDACLIDAL